MIIKRDKSKGPGHIELRIQNLLAGLAKLSPQETLDVLGTSSAPGTVSSELGKRLVPYTDANAAHQAASEAVKARDAAEAETVSYVEGVEAAVVSHFGATNQRLADFGLTPRKARRKATPAERLARTQKANATRARVKQARAQPAPAPNAGGTTNQGGAPAK
ncbi:MAG TPA: hypothetical protein VFF73_21970 [Planctomycetota bacterium]|nr:hypothetical protein [Planctomycetota bacterium]